MVWCKETTMAQTSFVVVKAILDGALAGWIWKNKKAPDLSVHGDPNFGWQSKQQLAQSQAFGMPLIDPTKVGNGQGAQNNLVIALATGVPGFPRMPKGGPFLPKEQTDYIAQWIDDNMPS
jgi:hypothetical protein